MPERNVVLPDWNNLNCAGYDGASEHCMTDWSNPPQGLDEQEPVFAMLNSSCPLMAQGGRRAFEHDHPCCSEESIHLRHGPWNPKASRNSRHCGRNLGTKFHDDALQAGFPLGRVSNGVRRPWRAAEKCGQMHFPSRPLAELAR